MNADPADQVAARIWQGLRVLVFEQHDRRREVSRALDLSFVRVKALRRLAQRPMTMRELATELIIDPPYTTVVVADLERRGLVRRAVHPDDRRVKIVSTTPEGARAAELAERILGEPPAALAALAPADLAALDRIVATLTAAEAGTEA